MRYFKYVALLAVLMLPLAYSQAQVGVGISVGARPGYYDEPADADSPPVCSYGYYSYYPYACAPYGYYGPQWFAGGVFIGAGPWYHWGWGHGGYYRPRRILPAEASVAGEGATGAAVTSTDMFEGASLGAENITAEVKSGAAVVFTGEAVSTEVADRMGADTGNDPGL